MHLADQCYPWEQVVFFRCTPWLWCPGPGLGPLHLHNSITSSIFTTHMAIQSKFLYLAYLLSKALQSTQGNSTRKQMTGTENNHKNTVKEQAEGNYLKAMVSCSLDLIVLRSLPHIWPAHHVSISGSASSLEPANLRSLRGSERVKTVFSHTYIVQIFCWYLSFFFHHCYHTLTSVSAACHDREASMFLL